ncbi:hypothetical protein C8J57DRAFT_1235430 [Mycena rebaudengoi]|nr:hypothetical protein C8J57DRAFT_1235430 [Mycena rebaudengoi]
MTHRRRRRRRQHTGCPHRNRKRARRPIDINTRTVFATAVLPVVKNKWARGEIVRNEEKKEKRKRHRPRPDGVFFLCLASHPAAHPGTLVDAIRVHVPGRGHTGGAVLINGVLLARINPIPILVPINHLRRHPRGRNAKRA